MKESDLLKELDRLAKELTAHLSPTATLENYLIREHGDKFEEYRKAKIIQINNAINVVNLELTRSTKQ